LANARGKLVITTETWLKEKKKAERGVPDPKKVPHAYGKLFTCGKEERPRKDLRKGEGKSVA